VILIGISIFIFILLHAVYPSPAIIVLGPRASPAAINAWNQQHGFDEPVIVQYWQYMYAVLHGNLGYSYKLNQTVAALFGERWDRSAYLSGTSLVLSVLIAVPLGIYQAVKRNTFGDGVVTSVAFTFYSMPDFLLYLIAIEVFALTLHVVGFEASQSTSLISVIGDWHDMTLPIACITVLILAGYSRYMRSSAIDTLATTASGCCSTTACRTLPSVYPIPGARLGQGVGERAAARPHRPGEREEDLGLPEQAVHVAEHLRHQPAVAGCGRPLRRVPAA
jgi:peptide/nickel transport system permease protein